MAVRAGDAGVFAGQRETCIVVVESRRAPDRSAVANIALLRESHRDVVRITRALKILQVAAHAGGVCDVVVSAGVTLAALERGVRPGQRPTCGGVIEGRRRPVRGGMADLALLREAR